MMMMISKIQFTIRATQINDTKYCYLSLTIQLNISHLFTHLNDQRLLFQAIQSGISNLFSFSFNV